MREFVCSGCVQAGLAKNIPDSKFFQTGDADIDSGKKNPARDTRCPYCQSVGTVRVIQGT